MRLFLEGTFGIFSIKNLLRLYHLCEDFDTFMFQKKTLTPTQIHPYIYIPIPIHITYSTSTPPKITHRSFNPKTLWRITREILHGMKFLEQNRMVHGDIRPELISVPVKREDNFRLVDRLADASPPVAIQLKNLQDRKDLYMSPDFFRCLSRKSKSLRHNPFKTDVFSLGLVILEAGLLEAVQSIYSERKRDIDTEKRVKFVRKFIEKYNEDVTLQETLIIMLEFSEDLRQTPSELLQTIRDMRTKTQRVTRESQNHLVTRLRFTESGYELVGLDQSVRQSSFYRFTSEAISSSCADSRGKSMKQSLLYQIRSGKQGNVSESRITEKGESQISDNSGVDSKETGSKKSKKSFTSSTKKSVKDWKKSGVMKSDCDTQELSDITVGDSSQFDFSKHKKQRSQGTVKKQMNADPDLDKKVVNIATKKDDFGTQKRFMLDRSNNTSSEVTYAIRSKPVLSITTNPIELSVEKSMNNSTSKNTPKAKNIRIKTNSVEHQNNLDNHNQDVMIGTYTRTDIHADRNFRSDSGSRSGSGLSSPKRVFPDKKPPKNFTLKLPEPDTRKTRSPYTDFEDFHKMKMDSNFTYANAQLSGQNSYNSFKHYVSKPSPKDHKHLIKFDGYNGSFRVGGSKPKKLIVVSKNVNANKVLVHDRRNSNAFSQEQ